MTTAAATAAMTERPDLRLWLASAMVVLGLHAAGGMLLAFWHNPPAGEIPGAVVMINLAPEIAAPSETTQDIAPGPLQEKADPPPDPQPEKPDQTEEVDKPLPQEAKIEEKIEPPPPEVKSEVVLPQQQPVRPPPKPIAKPRAPATTAPQRQERVAALPTAPAVAATANPGAMSSWKDRIVAQIQRNKNYPEDAKARGDTGTAAVSFVLDRQGRVLASHLARSSGVSALDQETVATVRRAQPFPPPPSDVPGATFNFTVPIRFNIR